MIQFHYQARDKTGKHISGVEQATTRGEVIEKLRAQGVFPISVELLKPAPGLAAPDGVRLSERELVFFTRQLSNLLGAGVSLPKALSLLEHQTNNYAAQQLCASLYTSVNEGGNFWESLGRFPAVFSRVYVGMVKAAELGGDMEKVFDHLADFMERKKELRDVLVSMLMYPIIVLSVGLAAVIFLMTFVVPRMLFLFSDSDAPLPLLTMLLIAMSSFLSAWWWLLLLAVIAGGIAFWKTGWQGSRREKVEEWLYQSPWLGVTLQKIIFSRFCYIVSLLLSNGLSLLHCLDLSRDIISSRVIAAKLDAVRQRVAQGGALSVSMRQEKFFPSTMVDMVSVGEETGRLEQMLAKVAQIYDKETREEIKRMLNIVEPVLILCIAVVVGLLVAAMLLPIFQFNLQAL